jgi:hypothetical protein
MTMGGFDQRRLPALQAASSRDPDCLCSRVAKKPPPNPIPGQVECGRPGIAAQNVAPETSLKCISDAFKALPDSISATFRPAAVHGVTQKPVPQINHGVLYILPQIFLSRISALIHFWFLGSIWRPRV